MTSASAIRRELRTSYTSIKSLSASKVSPLCNRCDESTITLALSYKLAEVTILFVYVCKSLPQYLAGVCFSA